MKFNIQKRDDHLKRLKDSFLFFKAPMDFSHFISSEKAFQIYNDFKHKLNNFYSNWTSQVSWPSFVNDIKYKVLLCEKVTLLNYWALGDFGFILYPQGRGIWRVLPRYVSLKLRLKWNWLLRLMKTQSLLPCFSLIYSVGSKISQYQQRSFGRLAYITGFTVFINVITCFKWNRNTNRPCLHSRIHTWFSFNHSWTVSSPIHWAMVCILMSSNTQKGQLSAVL